MKFTCTQENLLKGLTVVSPLAGRNVQLPILQYVLLEVRDGVLHLTCTDLEVGAHVSVGGKAEKNGNCAALARQLLEYVQQLPVTEPINIERKKNKLTITTKGFSSVFPISETDDFPLLPTPPNKEGIIMDGRLFCQGISNTVFAAARDEARPEIYSVFIQGNKGEVRLAATDSFRLAERVVPVDNEKKFSFLLPVTAAQEVSRLFGASERLELLIQDNYVVWRGEEMYLSSRLIDGSYPDYQQIIPTSFVTKGVVKREELARALKILSVFLSRESRRVSLLVQPGKEKLTAQVEGGEAGQGKVALTFEGEGEDIKVLFNVQYLLDGIQHIGGEQCELELGGESDPVVMRPVKSSLQQIYLVMPIQA
ncbi:MAG: DNA polymerase III subunit beta [bacterium]